MPPGVPGRHGASDNPWVHDWARSIGTLGAIHYTVSVRSTGSFIEADRYDQDPLSNNTPAQATPLNDEGSDIMFNGPGNLPLRLWEMTVPDLTLHEANDHDYFRLRLPDKVVDDCTDLLPGCDFPSPLGEWEFGYHRPKRLVYDLGRLRRAVERDRA